MRLWNIDIFDNFDVWCISVVGDDSGSLDNLDFEFEKLDYSLSKKNCRDWEYEFIDDEVGFLEFEDEVDE